VKKSYLIFSEKITQIYYYSISFESGDKFLNTGAFRKTANVCEHTSD